MTYGQRVLSDGTVNGSGVRVTHDTPGYLPSAAQESPAIACGSSAGTSLVVWHDQGRKASATLEWGIWGRVWAPTWQIYVPATVRGY